MIEKTVRICMVHPTIKDVKGLKECLHLTGQEPYEFVWDDVHPQYIVATEMIYEDVECHDRFMKLYTIADIAIYIAGECIAPDLNIFDYVISFDRNLSCDDRVGRMPMREFYNEYIPHLKNDICTVEDAKAELDSKTGFCNFIYSNPNGTRERTEIFQILQNYKKVDSLGRYLNNVGHPLQLAPADVGWAAVIAESIEVKSRYKFSIAFENASYAGYTSEKVFSSLAAHTVPIYWGNVHVSREVNEKAIINCYNFSSWEDVLREVQRIDQDDDLWIEKIRQPWLTDAQIKAEQDDLRSYSNFLQNIFMQPIERAHRRGRGTHPDHYMKWFFRDDSETVRIKKNHDVEMAWLKKIYAADSCINYFIKNQLRKVAIYGMGDLGRCLYADLKAAEKIEIICLIDKNNPRNLPEDLLCKPEDLLDKRDIDVVVVSLPHLYEEIRDMLRGYTESKIISIEEIVR